MTIPKPPWYGAVNKKLEGAEWLINPLLIGIAVITIVLLVRGDRVSRTAWLVYLLSP